MYILRCITFVVVVTMVLLSYDICICRASDDTPGPGTPAPAAQPASERKPPRDTKNDDLIFEYLNSINNYKPPYDLQIDKSRETILTILQRLSELRSEPARLFGVRLSAVFIAHDIELPVKLREPRLTLSAPAQMSSVELADLVSLTQTLLRHTGAGTDPKSDFASLHPDLTRDLLIAVADSCPCARLRLEAAMKLANAATKSTTDDPFARACPPSKVVVAVTSAIDYTFDISSDLSLDQAAGVASLLDSFQLLHDWAVLRILASPESPSESPQILISSIHDSFKALSQKSGPEGVSEICKTLMSAFEADVPVLRSELSEYSRDIRMIRPLLGRYFVTVNTEDAVAARSLLTPARAEYWLKKYPSMRDQWGGAPDSKKVTLVSYQLVGRPERVNDLATYTVKLTLAITDSAGKFCERRDDITIVSLKTEMRIGSGGDYIKGRKRCQDELSTINKSS